MASNADLPADIDPLALVARWPQRYPAFLDSSAENPLTGRLDLLPISDGRFMALGRDGLVRDQAGRDLGADFAGCLDEAFARERSAASEGDGPGGGWLLYLGYEAVAQFEHGLGLPAFELADLPVALAVRTPACLWRDHVDGSVTTVAEPGHEALLDQLDADLRVLADTAEANPTLPSVQTLIEDDPQRFLTGVQRVLDHLHAGDTFQVNLSRAWLAQFADVVDPVALYRRLRQLSPAPFSALLRWRQANVLSASPERLLRVRGRRIDTRPIAGTRPRGTDPASDAALRAELIAHPKERAEHVMLIDLERNDMGRVCVPGSIRVDEMMTLESYAHVHHIVSNVTGELRPDVTPGQILRALFPGGTITGCPKVRCMQIIAALEGTGRGPYTGAIGYLDRHGDMDLNILIRSAWLQDRRLGFRTGAGIVADSVAERELAETRAKARGMLALLGR
jgi:anthranilate synthase component 1